MDTEIEIDEVEDAKIEAAADELLRLLLQAGVGPIETCCRVLARLSIMLWVCRAPNDNEGADEELWATVDEVRDTMRDNIVRALSELEQEVRRK